MRQVEIAAELGVSGRLISQWEATRWPTAAACERYLRAIDAILLRRRSQSVDEPEAVAAGVDA